MYKIMIPGPNVFSSFWNCYLKRSDSFPLNEDFQLLRIVPEGRIVSEFLEINQRRAPSL